MRKTVYSKLRHANIYLYGVSELSKEVYEKYKEVLNIQGCITNYVEMQKIGLLDEYGVKTILLSEYNAGQDNLIIVCDEKLYDDNSNFYSITKALFRDNNLKENEDYISHIVIEPIIEQRRIMVIMGPLICEQVYLWLSAQESLKSWWIIYYDEDRIMMPYFNDFEEYRHTCEFADVYIYSISNKNRYHLKVVKPNDLPQNCISISISGYMFNPYYLQIETNQDAYSNFLIRDRLRVNRNYAKFVLAREDVNLVRMIREGLDVEKIVREVSSEDFYNEEQVISQVNNAFDQIRESDLKADIKLEDKIRSEFDKTLITHNLDEWNSSIIEYIGIEICKKLGIDYLEGISEDIFEKELGTELPVYPSVLKALKIWIDDKKYKVVTFDSEGYMNFEDYIRYCVEALIRAKRFMDMMSVRPKEDIQIVSDYVENREKKWPEKYAYDEPKYRITYFKMSFCIRHVASFLIAKGYTHKYIAVYFDLKRRDRTTFWALAMSNNIYCPLDIYADKERAAEIIKKNQIDVLITDYSSLDDIPKCLQNLFKEIYLFDECMKSIVFYSDIIGLRDKVKDSDVVYSDLFDVHNGEELSQKDILDSEEVLEPLELRLLTY